MVGVWIWAQVQACLSSVPHNCWPFSFRGSFSVSGRTCLIFLFHQWFLLLGWLGLWCGWLLNCGSWSSCSCCLYSNRDWEGLKWAGLELGRVRYQLEFIFPTLAIRNGEVVSILYCYTLLSFSVPSLPGPALPMLPGTTAMVPTTTAIPFQTSCLPVPFLPFSVMWSGSENL